jgi:hypothetical protein
MAARPGLLTLGFAFVAAVLLCLEGAEGVGDALVGGVSLSVHAVGVDLERDGGDVPRPGGLQAAATRRMWSDLARAERAR